MADVVGTTVVTVTDDGSDVELLEPHGQYWERYKQATPGPPVMLVNDRDDVDGTSVVCHSTSVGH